MNNRYQIITVYDDMASKTETTTELMNALRAAAIYWEDASCISITIWDWEATRDVMHYERPTKV